MPKQGDEQPGRHQTNPHVQRRTGSQISNDSAITQQQHENMRYREPERRKTEMFMRAHTDRLCATEE